jgi:hypothetical protein
VTAGGSGRADVAAAGPLASVIGLAPTCKLMLGPDARGDELLLDGVIAHVDGSRPGDGGM